MRHTCETISAATHSALHHTFKTTLVTAASASADLHTHKWMTKIHKFNKRNTNPISLDGKAL